MTAIILQRRFKSISFFITHTLCSKSKRQNKTIKHISLSIIYVPEFKFGQDDGVVCM